MRSFGCFALFFLAGPGAPRPDAFLADLGLGLLRKRESVQNLLGLAILGYHFRKIHEDLLGRPQTGPTRREAVEKQTQLPEPAMLLVK